MPINIKIRRVEELIDEVVALTGETKVEAVRRALEERKARLMLSGPGADRFARLMRVIESGIWSLILAHELGRHPQPSTRAQRGGRGRSTIPTIGEARRAHPSGPGSIGDRAQAMPATRSATALVRDHGR